MDHPTDRIAHTTAFVTPVVEHWLEREIAHWVYSMKDRSDDQSHNERTLLPRSYISLPIPTTTIAITSVAAITIAITTAAVTTTTTTTTTAYVAAATTITCAGAAAASLSTRC